MATASVLLPMLNPSSSNSLYNKEHGKVSTSSRTIVLFPESTSYASCIPSYETIDEGTNKNNIDSMLIKKQKASKTISFGEISRRLKKRKELNNRL